MVSLGSIWIEARYHFSTVFKLVVWFIVFLVIAFTESTAGDESIEMSFGRGVFGGVDLEFRRTRGK